MLRSCERDPAGCVRHQLDDASGDSPSAATDDDWNAGDEPAASKSQSAADAKAAPAEQARSEEQVLANEESYVLNQVCTWPPCWAEVSMLKPW